MTLFRITDSYLTYNYQLGNQGLKMTIAMERKTTSEMLTTYFPSLLLMLITFATTFFKPFFFEAALSVNLTTMLVMTTIFISKLEGLPRTSYIKMIDYWLILCQLVPFTEVVLLTAMEYIREDDDQGENVSEYNKEKKKGVLKTLKVVGKYTKYIHLRIRFYRKDGFAGSGCGLRSHLLYHCCYLLICLVDFSL